MLIYEVNLAINKNIYADFMVWLEDHVREMLTVSGFESAKVLTVSETESHSIKKLTIHYTVRSEEDLKQYFDGRSSTLRQKAIDLFGSQFSIERRILKLMMQSKSDL